MNPVEIPHWFDPVPNSVGVDGKRLRQSATPVDPVSKVLGTDDLLIEILLLIGYPTTLICAALVCKRWFCHASDPAFLCRFRKLHPPCLLGVYFKTRANRSHFVPILPQPLENDAVISCASSSLDAHKLILDDWNSCVGFDSLKFLHISGPEGLVIGYKRTMLSRAYDNSGVYLIHLNGLQLCVWLRTGDNWLLVDTICLREMYAKLRMPDLTDWVWINQVGVNAEFVFLKMGRCLVYVGIKCRKLCKVYEMTSEDRWLGRIHPCMMIWPPTFHALKDGPASDHT